MSGRFIIHNTEIANLFTLERKPVCDKRGFLERMFCEAELEYILCGRKIKQINHTLTHQKGVVRGMHFQYQPHAEMKLVSCLKGKVFDVAIDLRKKSPTFLQWHGEVLTDENYKTFVIPEGFAHGFQTMTDCSEIIYFVTENYAPASEGAVNVIDPLVSIDWPLPISDLSEKDKNNEKLTVALAEMKAIEV